MKITKNLHFLYFLCLFIILNILKLNSSMKFKFNMKPINMQCIAEFLSEKTLMISTINANSKDIRVRLFDPNGNTVYNKVSKKILSKKIFTFLNFFLIGKYKYY